MSEPTLFNFNDELIFWAIVKALLVFVLVIVFTRLFGLRSYARLSTFDFAFTLAKGALIATIALNDNVEFFEGVAGLLVIYCCEWITATFRTRYASFNKLVSNKPVLLMYRGQYIEENIKATRVSMEDIYFAMRQSNVIRLEDVKAVVAEPTGQVSVLTGDADTVDKLLQGVKK